MTQLKEILKEVGISQQNLADSINVNAGRLSLIVNEKDMPTESEARKLENYFMLPIDSLLERRE